LRLFRVFVASASERLEAAKATIDEAVAELGKAAEKAESEAKAHQENVSRLMEQVGRENQATVEAEAVRAEADKTIGLLKSI